MRKRTKQFVALTASLLMLGSATACTPEKKVAAAELSAAYTRQATETGEITDDFRSAMANFSIELFKQTITKDSKNEVFSPLSAVMCLALIANGADGETLAQLQDLLGMDIDALNRSLYAYADSLYTSKDCSVNLANSVWIREGFPVKADFLQTNADWYGAQAYQAPFAATTVNDINNWCFNKTNGKIKKVLERISPDEVMYLINALDFDAKWNVEYEKTDISDDVFRNYDETQSDVKMLFSSESTYLSDDDAIGFLRPYKDRKYSFVGLLPNEGMDVYEYIENLSGEGWQALWDSRSYASVIARMPEFTYEAEHDLTPILQTLGATDMFTETADFSKMSDATPLYCGFIKQKVFIQVDREGTKAAAITIGGMDGESAGPDETIYIALDRPYVYAIVDNATGLPLFLGAVTNL